MSTSSLTKLAAPLGTAAVLLLLLNGFFGRTAPGHFLPEQKMSRALQASADCVLLLGDSRMDAGHSAEAFRAGSAPDGAGSCATNLAIGGTDVRGAFLAARRFFGLGGRTPRAVLGISADSVLDPKAALDPTDMVGNEAIHLIWSVPSDVFAQYPGFPFANIGVADAGFRFLVGRATALGEYQSLVWLFVQRAQNRLTGMQAESRNGFGAVADMNGLELDFRQRARERLASVAGGNGGPLSWLDRLRELLRARRVPLLLVELPMPSSFQRGVSDSDTGREYRVWLLGQLSARGVDYIDLSRPEWLNDSLFADALHLNAEGAARFSHDLATHLRQEDADWRPTTPTVRP